MERTLELKRSRVTPLLFGIQDANLRYIEEQLGVHIRTHDTTVLVVGESAPTLLTVRLLEGAYSLLEAGIRLDLADLGFLLRLLENGEDLSPQTLLAERIAVPSQKRFISPKSLGQRRYIQAIRQHDIVIGIGPAGTGKTYIAVAMAVYMFLNKKVERLILSRPAVEAGEKLGFLPGDLQEKVNPYLRPLYDALYDMLDAERVARYIERGTIEIAPIAFMRGRTLNDSFVILDEAQNTTSEQMKMFLTRLGFGAKAVITGDITQIDLPIGRISGLVEAMKVVGAIEGISFVYFDDRDVVRHKLVQQIVKAYEAFVTGGSAARPSSLRSLESVGVVPSQVEPRA
jgi:phosphate starvation-inducible PhoH-like protein